MWCLKLYLGEYINGCVSDWDAEWQLYRFDLRRIRSGDRKCRTAVHWRRLAQCITTSISSYGQYSGRLHLKSVLPWNQNSSKPNHSISPHSSWILCETFLRPNLREALINLKSLGHFISLYFTFTSPSGAYLFKAYSNGHPYDTSQVWVALFTALLKENPTPLLPAIIVPGSYPNQRTWEALRRYNMQSLFLCILPVSL